MDQVARRTLRPWLEGIARRGDTLGVRPVHLTVLGLVLGIGAAVAAALGWWWVALAVWLVSRVPDGLDGVLARLQRRATDLGGFLDIMADFAAYGGFVLGVAIGVPDARVACAALLVAYYLNGSAFLAISGLAEKRLDRMGAEDGERSLQFVTGLTEGFETIVAHAVFALLAALQPTWVTAAVWVFTAMVVITVGQRVVCGVRFLREMP